MGRKFSDKEIKLITNALRRASLIWPGRREALARASKKEYVRTAENLTEIYKTIWQCAQCEKWFRDIKQVQVDHIVEIGPFKGNWEDYVQKMFCPQDNLQVLCIVCHAKKTSGFNAALRFKRKR